VDRLLDGHTFGGNVVEDGLRVGGLGWLGRVRKWLRWVGSPRLVYDKCIVVFQNALGFSGQEDGEEWQELSMKVRRL
jgi:hypothetical protein